MSDNKRIVQYGEWKIEVDIEETERYYRSQRIAYPQKYDSQANRNLTKYCETMTEEEKTFFDSFCIDPICTKVDTIGVSRKGDYPCGGYYFICGKYLEHPERIVLTPEDLFDESDNEIDYPDTSVRVGIFQFDFELPDDEFSEIPEDIPEGFIGILFWCEDMKWLLDEPCEEKMYEAPRFWEIGRKIKEYVNQKKELKATAEAIKNEYLSFFEEHGIIADTMNKNELDKFKNGWIERFSPADQDKKEIKRICLSTRRYTAYLWHLFSYEIISCLTEDTAKSAFDKENKNASCIFTDNLYDHSFLLDNASQITADLLETFDDVMITAADYSWTYCKTHEEGLGPYYYKKSIIQKE